MNEVQVAHNLTMTPVAVVRRSVAIVLGAVLVALGAQAAVPLAGTPVPVTLQVPAVLIVGCLLGPRLGAASMVVYLMLGAAGLPVFAPAGVPGFARLVGPTGGYLLAYPAAAAIVGLVAGRGESWARLALGLVAGVGAIHVAGVVQLAALTGSLHEAVVLGSLPFLLGDVLKIIVAGLVIRRLSSRTRALL